MEGRVNLDKFKNALRTMENFYIAPHGPAIFRPGFRYISGAKHNDKYCRLIKFKFSVTDAYILEFGDEYIRFYKQDRTQVAKAYAAWVTSTWYYEGDLVSTGTPTVYYRCLINHQSGTFATDLAAGKWVVSGGASDTAYEIPSPYDHEDVDGIKYFQSADVLYLYHPDYPTHKLGRVSTTFWQLVEINYQPPPTTEQYVYPAYTLTPSATTGSGITFTASGPVFMTSDVNRIIMNGMSRGIVSQYTSATEVKVDIIDAFKSTQTISSGDWKIYGSPKATLTPSDHEPEGEVITVTGSSEGALYIDLLDPAYDDFRLSGSGTGEYYLISTAPNFQASKPTSIYINSALAVEGILGGLGISQWAWGDNDALGYNTIYVRLFGSVDPDTFAASYIQARQDTYTAGVFRSDDVGKYIRMSNGQLQITTYLSPQQVRAKIIRVLDDASATTSWTLEGDIYDATNGYPQCGAFYEDRLISAGSAGYPGTFRGSVVSDYENHLIGTGDADALDYTINSREVNSIVWMEPREYLILGTASGEWRVGPEDTGSALTPTSVIAKQMTPYGCAPIMPLTIGNCTLFVQAQKREIREFTMNPTSVYVEYVAPDLTLLSEHVTKGLIKGMAYAKHPYGQVWAYMEDGTTAVMTYLRDQEVVGWSRIWTDGTIESIETIPGDDYSGDEVWAVVKRSTYDWSSGSRVINTVRYIECLDPVFSDESATFVANKGLNAFYVDSGITYNGAATTTITGLSHLVGRDVSILADGGVRESQRVTSGGQITLDRSASVVHVGLPYEGTLETMRVNAQTQSGTIQGQIKRIVDLVVRVDESGTFKAGIDIDNLFAAVLRNSDQKLGSPSSLYTGDKRVSIEGTYDRDGRIMIYQDKPLPLTVVSLMIEAAI